MRGDLIWVNNEFAGQVKFVPNQNGRFLIVQAPEVPNNKLWFGTNAAPGNKAHLSAGIDPVDHMKTKDTNSLFALSIFRHMNPLQEPDYVKFAHSDDDQLIYEHTELGKTNKFICNYMYRPDDPREAYADAAKALIWYGTDVLVEIDKPGFSNWMKENGLEQYLAYKTQDMGVGATASSTQGAKATTQLIAAWVDELKSYLYNYYESLADLEQIRQFRNFTGENQGKLDLLVASGLALMLYRQKTVNQNRFGKRIRANAPEPKPARHPLSW